MGQVALANRKIGSHNAYRTDYGAAPRGQDKVWWRLFDDDDIVQVEVLKL